MDITDRITQALGPLSSLPHFLGSILMNEDGDIVENQLPVSDEKAAQVIAPLWSILVGLKRAGRHVKSLHTSSGSHHYSTYMLEDGSYLAIRFSESYNPDEVGKRVSEIRKNLEACVADFTKSLFINSSETGEKSLPPISTNSSESTNKGADPDAGKYLKALSSMMSRVAPAGQIQAMLNRALEKNNCTHETLQKSDFSAIGISLVESVPNKGRRKMIQKEFDIIATKFNI